jgi:hypothetical protein
VITPSVPHNRADHNNGGSISFELEDPSDTNTPAQQEPWRFSNQFMAVFVKELQGAIDLKLSKEQNRHMGSIYP